MAWLCNYMSIILERGERGILVGQTGSGKTWGAIYQMQHSPQNTVIVLDTKGEPAFNTLPLGAETHDFYDSGDEFARALKGRELPNYMIVRPSPDEMAEPLEMDNILRKIEVARKPCLVYVDEAYQWHVSGRAGAGLTGILTRGRSMGISTLIATQRPSWISRFCFSEAQKFFIYKLSDKRDRKTISEHIPDFSADISIPKFKFWYYNNVGDMHTAQFYAPVPAPKKAVNITDSGRKWI